MSGNSPRHPTSFPLVQQSGRFPRDRWCRWSRATLPLLIGRYIRLSRTQSPEKTMGLGGRLGNMGVPSQQTAVAPVCLYGKSVERSMIRSVQKSGGTSLADVDRIKNVARRVRREVDAGNEVAVVVSAMAGVTNQLVDWRRQTTRRHDP